MTLQNDLADRSSKPFVEHLDDLRKTVVWIAVFVFVGVIIAIPLAPLILEWLKVPYYRGGLDKVVDLRVMQVGGGLAIAMRVVVWSGLLMSLPFVVLSIGHFVFPGLTARERKSILCGGGLSVALFAIGVMMGYRWTLPVALQVMSGIEQWMGTPAEFWETSGYVGFSLKVLIAFGLTFQLPVVLLALGHMGIISSRQLRDKRRHVVVALFVLAMFLTPSDPITQILMAVPLVALYEACVWMIWAKERRNRTEKSA